MPRTRGERKSETYNHHSLMAEAERDRKENAVRTWSLVKGKGETEDERKGGNKGGNANALRIAYGRREVALPLCLLTPR